MFFAIHGNGGRPKCEKTKPFHASRRLLESAFFKTVPPFAMNIVMIPHRDKRSKGEGSVQDVIPLYYKIYEILRKQIERGDFPESLPGEHELASRFQVSRVTIRRTMAILADANLISRLRGRGTFVNPDAIIRGMPANFSGFDQNVKDFEATTRVDLIGTQETELPSWCVKALGENAVSEGVLGIEYARSADGIPFSYIRAFVPLRIARSLNLDNIGSKTATTMIEETGVVVVDIDQKLTAIAADEAAAATLQLPLGEPLIRVRRVMYDESRVPVGFLEAAYNPRYFEYHVTLSREKKRGEAPRWVPASR